MLFSIFARAPDGRAFSLRTRESFVKIQDMSATTDRDIAMRVAETDFKKSLILARRVSEPWFRCQALAGTARYAPEEDVVQIAEEAIAASLTETEPYMKVAATAWPFRALIERNQEQKAIQLLPTVLTLSSQIENSKGRSDALFVLWEAFFPSRGHESILAALITSCTGHSKAGYVLCRVVLILASEDIDEARKLASSMPEGNYKRQAERRLGEGQKEQVREFFYKKTSA